MSNVKMSLLGVIVAVLAIGTAQAAPTLLGAKSKSTAAKTHKVVHSPYARAAAAHATAPAPGNPIKGHNLNMVQGQGMSSQRRHAVGKPH